MRSWNSGAFAQDDFKLSRNVTLNLGLRYELLMPITDQDGRLANYLPELGKLVIASDKAVPDLERRLAEVNLTGKVVFAKDIGLPPSLVFANYNNFAPRFGFAWRPGGSNRTVVRSGYGYFYGSSINDPVRGELATLYPFSLSTTYNRNASRPLELTLSDPFPRVRESNESVVNSAGHEVRPKASNLQSWNLTIEREAGKEVAIEIAYAGSEGTHLGRRYDVNQPDRSSGRTPFPRPYPGFNAIQYFGFGANSSYHSGMVTVRRRFNRGFFYRLNYVYAKSIDDASQLSGNSKGGYPGAQDARNLRLERGRSDWDTRHSFLMNFTWDVPIRRNVLLRSWQISATGRAYTGQPFTPRTSNVQLDQGEANRPDRIAAGSLANPTADAWFDLAAFPTVPLGSFRFGNSGRNILDGPGFIGMNSALYRRFAIRERGSIQFRWEVFNTTNHPNLNLPQNLVNAPNGGTIIDAQPSRTMQFALKWLF